MELKEGMYVRFFNGDIGKIANYEYKEEYVNGHVIYLEKDDKTGWCCEEKDFKASYNIIDLIEERDYIRIITSAYFEPVYYSYGKLVIRDDIDISKYTNKFIAEVITHEQMESMSYKVGD